MRLAPRDAQTAIMPSRPFVFSATTILSLALLILLATSHWSEARTVRWAKQAGAADSEASTAIGVDGSGNSYITGYFGGSTTLGLGEANQTTLVSAGASDLFLAKYSPSGALIWAKRAGGTGFEEAFAITVDGSGNSYVTGYFEGAASFGPGEANQTILPAPAGGAGIFIAKYNSNGALVWAKRAAGSGSGQGFGITVSKTENVYVTGSFTGSVSFGLGEANQKTLTSDGGFDLFIAKYDSNGALLWARRAGGTGSDEAFASAVDDAGNVSVTGSFEGTAIFGLGEPNQTILNSSGSNEMFVAQYNSNGTLLWARREGGTGFIDGFGIARDGAGDLYVVGTFYGSAAFGSGEVNQTILTSLAGFNGFIAKYTSNGELLWAKQTSLLTGSLENFGIAADASGNSYVTGYFDGTATFGLGETGETSLTAVGGFDIFIAKYNTSGSLVWAKTAGGVSLDVGVGIAVDGNGDVHVTGYFDGVATFGLGEANETLLTSAGGYDLFVAKFAGKKTDVDFDGDGKADFAVYRSGAWFIRNSSGASTMLGWGGASEDIVVQADYDGDGKEDVAVFRNGTWFISKSSGGTEGVDWGAAGDIPVVGDYDGDGKSDLAVYRRGAWFILNSSGGSQVSDWGLAGDIPVPADYDGDGKTDIAVFRNGTWFVLKSAGGSRVVGWGAAGDIPVIGDYDGDGKSDLAVFRVGAWFILKSSGGSQVSGWGSAGDIPVPADYDGDGKTDIAVFRNGTWFVSSSTGGTHTVGWGAADDLPIN